MEPAVFSLLLEFRKLLEPGPGKPAWNINKKECMKLQFKVKGLSVCFILIGKCLVKIAQFLTVTVSGKLLGLHFFEYQQRITTTVQTGGTTLLQLLLVTE